MKKFVIKDYQRGFEEDQVRIGIEVAKKWVWPYAYDLRSLLRIHSQPDFDPDTRHYCFLGDEMVGYLFSVVTPSEEGGVSSATMDFPRVLSGYEEVSELLIEKAFERLKAKKVSRVVGRVTTMSPGDIRLAEKVGFNIHDWGYKVYYDYEMGWGKPNLPCNLAEEIDPEADLDECAIIAAKWYKRPIEWCRTHLEEWHEAGIITHVGVRKEGRLIASCMVAPNDVRPSTAAIFYIYTPDEAGLIPLLVKVVNKCVDQGIHNVIADLINENRQYEPIYQEIGFRKVADWALCEMDLT
jgi:hypothetical protein